jgi:hypothetical protein
MGVLSALVTLARFLNDESNKKRDENKRDSNGKNNHDYFGNTQSKQLHRFILSHSMSNKVMVAYYFIASS